MGGYRHRVAGEQVLSLAQADHQRATKPRSDNLAGPAGADDRQPICPCQTRQGPLHCLEQIVHGVVLARDGSLLRLDHVEGAW